MHGKRASGRTKDPADAEALEKFDAAMLQFFHVPRIIGKDSKVSRTSGKTCVRLPKGRDPFVNARLVSLGAGARGREKFWISSCNMVAGSTGVVIDEDGSFRLYRLRRPTIKYCYSAAAEDENTLWLSVELSRVARLDLATGSYTLHDTGSEPAFVCCGGRFDPDSGKFFALGYLGRGGTDGTTAVSVDTKTRKAVVHRDVAPDQFMYSCHRHPDGSYTGLVVCPGASLVRWNPRSETVESIRIAQETSLHDGHPMFITDELGRAYFPGRGWYCLETRAFVPRGPRPEREATWFERHGRLAIGTVADALGSASVFAWDMDSGKVREITTIPSCTAHGITMSGSGKLISVNLVGEFRRHDLASGRLELFRRLPTDTVQPVDHLLRLDRDRLIGSTFITQRFWEVNIRTGRGYDCGRAAPGGGQVQHFWKLGKRVFITSYTTAKLLEYNPARHPNFPENPCVVAEPPDSMRPVAFADDGRRLFYSSNRPYGSLGCTVTRFDTRTGLSRFAVNPLPGESIRSLWLDRQRGVLLGHTTFHADCQSCPPATDHTSHVSFSAGDLSLLGASPLPPSIMADAILGPLDAGRLLCQYRCKAPERKPGQLQLAAVDRVSFVPPAESELRPAPEGTRQVLYAGRPGAFLVWRGNAVELWDMRPWRPLKTIFRDRAIRRLQVQDRSLYAIRKRDIVILDGVLPASRC